MSESQTIPASELGVPDEGDASKLSSDDVFRILTAKFRRGGHICVAFFVTAIVGFVVSLIAVTRTEG